MINAFKQIRLTNVNISGQDGRISVGNSGNLAFSSELEALSGVLASGISSANSSSNESLFALSGDLKNYVDNSISGVIDMAPDALNTLKELSAALNDDPDFASTLTNTLTNISGSLSSEISSAESAFASEISVLSGVLASDIASTGSALQSQIDSVSSSSSAALESGLALVSGDLNSKLDTASGFLQSGIDALGASLLQVSGEVDDLAVEIEVANNNISALSLSNNYLVSGLNAVNDQLFINSGEISQLKTGVNASLEVLISHQDRLQGIDDAISLLSSGSSINYRQAFSAPIPSGFEDLTILFPSGSFDSVPAINATLESEVGYMFSLKNKTVSGFDVSFSDVIQEENVFLDVIATIKS